jgi:AraC family transcriptional regulator
MLFEPPGVEHAERYGREGVRALLIEMSAARFDMVREIVPLRTPVCLEHATTLALAERLHRELRTRDTASALAIEGLALELVAHAGRIVDRSANAPSWLGLIVSRLRDECRQQLTVSDLAASAGVHPASVARVFRARMGCSVGEFQRRLRVEWAMTQLQRSDASLDAIALDAGFFDQSHFCRVFRRQVGASPGQFRRSARQESEGRPRSVIRWGRGGTKSSGPVELVVVIIVFVILVVVVVVEIDVVVEVIVVLVVEILFEGLVVEIVIIAPGRERQIRRRMLTHQRR